jgi:hypothetical protein
MNIQDYLTISRYFEYCWTGKVDDLKSLFDADAVHEHIHVGNTTGECLRERIGVDQIMEEYQLFFITTDLDSTKVYDLRIYPEGDSTVIAEYRIFQRKKKSDHEFKIKQNFEMTSESKIRRVRMEVEKLNVHCVRV